MAKQLTFARITKLMEPGRYFDGGSGLHLLVKSPQRKYWVFRFTFNGRRQDMGLGVFPRVSLAEARDAAQDARRLLDRSVSPLARKEAEKTAKPEKSITFHDFALEYVKVQRPAWRNEKHGDQWVYTLTEYAFPIIGNKALDEIDTDDILAILQPIWHTKTETASRLRGRIERVLAAATTRKLRSGINPALWRGHLDTLLARPRRISRVKHHAALPYQDMPAFMETLQARTAMAALALEFAILTAARTGEVIGAKRAEVKDGVWTVPAERMKAGRAHRVPLVPRSLAIIEKAKAHDPESDYLFSHKGRPLSCMAMLTLLDRMNCEVTVHGFRSTFRDWASEATRHSPELAEMGLAHVILNKAEAAYRRGDLLDARRQLMLDWEAFCLGKLGKIITLRAA